MVGPITGAIRYTGRHRPRRRLDDAWTVGSTCSRSSKLTEAAQSETKVNPTARGTASLFTPGGTHESGHRRCRVWQQVPAGFEDGTKEMFPVIDRPAIDFILQELRDSGIEDVMFITSRASAPWRTTSTAR